MKYSKEVYETGQFIEHNTCAHNKTQKLVKVRKEHVCALCSNMIQVNEQAVTVKALIKQQGWISCYICLKCCDQWLEATKQV